MIRKALSRQDRSKDNKLVADNDGGIIGRNNQKRLPISVAGMMMRKTWGPLFVGPCGALNLKRSGALVHDQSATEHFEAVQTVTRSFYWVF